MMSCALFCVYVYSVLVVRGRQRIRREGGREEEEEGEGEEGEELRDRRWLERGTRGRGEVKVQDVGLRANRRDTCDTVIVFVLSCKELFLLIVCFLSHLKKFCCMYNT